MYNPVMKTQPVQVESSRKSHHSSLQKYGIEKRNPQLENAIRHDMNLYKERPFSAVHSHVFRVHALNPDVLHRNSTTHRNDLPLHDLVASILPNKIANLLHGRHRVHIHAILIIVVDRGIRDDIELGILQRGQQRPHSAAVPLMLQKQRLHRARGPVPHGHGQQMHGRLVVMEEVPRIDDSRDPVRLRVQIRQRPDIVRYHVQDRRQHVGLRERRVVALAAELPERRRHHAALQIELVVVSSVDIAHQHVHVAFVALARLLQRLVEAQAPCEQPRQAEEGSPAHRAAAHALADVLAGDLEDAHAAADVDENERVDALLHRNYHLPRLISRVRGNERVALVRVDFLQEGDAADQTLQLVRLLAGTTQQIFQKRLVFVGASSRSGD